MFKYFNSVAYWMWESGFPTQSERMGEMVPLCLLLALLPLVWISHAVGVPGPHGDPNSSREQPGAELSWQHLCGHTGLRGGCSPAAGCVAVSAREWLNNLS